MHFPESLLKELEEKFALKSGPFLEAHERSTPVSIRVNPLKPDCDLVKGDKVPWSEHAFYLLARPVFTNDPLFHAGCYYVQEASSMFVEEAVRQTMDLSKKIIALDACAAPGGKSTLLAAVLNQESLLVSNEVISTRVPVLVHNMVKWGAINSVVSNNDPKDFSRLSNFFDLMVVDAPCSGSGLFRKQEDAVEHWSEENVKHCSLRQQRILHDLIHSLKENGILIYSTCSYSEEENEIVCDKLVKELGLEPIQLKLQAHRGIVEVKSKDGGFGYRFFPHLLQGEGFFLSCFRKMAGHAELVSASQSARHSKKYAPTPGLSAAESQLLEQLISSENLQFTKQGEEIVGHHASVSEEIKALSTLKLKKMPIHAGQVKGKDFIPHPYSAYLSCLSDKIQKAEVDKETALKFLRKQPFTLDSKQKGFELLTYKGNGLGWFKNLGNRINNYYPADWRILKEVF